MQPSTGELEVSSLGSEFDAYDEWRNDIITFPTVSDALLAKIAFSKDADATSFLSHVENPLFNPGECTLHELTEIHSYAHSFRKRRMEEKNGSPTGGSTIPCFVWEEVIILIGSQWMGFVSDLLDETSVGHGEFDGKARHAFERFDLLNQGAIDLRNASLVHRSWTGAAQRQLGRVLILRDLSDLELSSALASPLYGNWTQVFALRGSTRLKQAILVGGRELEHLNNLQAALPRLRTLFTRLPRLTTLYFVTSFGTQPFALLNVLKATHSGILQVISINVECTYLSSATKGLVALVSNWPALRRISLVGCTWDEMVMDLRSESYPALFDFVLTGGGGWTIHHDALIFRIQLAKCVDGTFGPFAVWMERVDKDWHSDERLAWLSGVHVLHLRNTPESEAEHLFNLMRIIEQLSYIGQDFVPSFIIPTSVHTLELALNVEEKYYDWHGRDRELEEFLPSKCDVGMKNLWITIRIEDEWRRVFSESREDFLDIYFPRASRICKKSNISFVPFISFHGQYISASYSLALS